MFTDLTDFNVKKNGIFEQLYFSQKTEDSEFLKEKKSRS